LDAVIVRNDTKLGVLAHILAKRIVLELDRAMLEPEEEGEDPIQLVRPAVVPLASECDASGFQFDDDGLEILGSERGTAVYDRLTLNLTVILLGDRL
jgi:hypothetical protein